MVVLLIAVMAVLGVVPASFGYTKHAVTQAQAVSAGQVYLDLIRQYVKTNGVDTGLPTPPPIPIDPGQGFIEQSTQTSVEVFQMAPSCSSRSLFSFDCSVTVRWDDGRVARSVKVESYIASQAGF